MHNSSRCFWSQIQQQFTCVISLQDSTFDSRCKFTTKELDNETNYTYFGARYYDSDLSIWLSVDPLASKHPDYTPYAYCYNNPVVYVDPFGLDTVLFNKRGKFQTPLPGGDENSDTYVRVSDKEFESNKISYNKKGELKGRHKNMQIDKRFRESMTQSGDSYIFEAGGNNKSKAIFEFFAKNTIVEWAHLIYEDHNSLDVTCETSTDHKEGYVTFNIPTDLKKGSYTLVDLRHSHPNGWISETDRYTHQYYNSKGPVKSYVLKYGQYFQDNEVRSSNEKYPVVPQSYK